MDIKIGSWLICQASHIIIPGKTRNRKGDCMLNMKLKRKLVKTIGCIYTMATVLSVSNFVYAADETENKMDIVIDGDLRDWKAMDALSVSDNSKVSEWKAAKSQDGKTLYFCFTGTAVTEWDSAYRWYGLNMSYPNGSNFYCQIANLQQGWNVPGAEVVTSCNASGNNPGRYVVECALPVSQEGYALTFAGTTVNEEDIPVFVSAEEAEPVYTGIVIDGNYEDWDAVTKYEAECSEEAHHTYDCLDYAACVFDGDYVYFYLQDGESGNAAGAGVFSNGRYAITTDMGRRLVFQISTANGGSVSGIAGAEAKYFGDEWEIAVPTSELPKYKESISFGLYQQDPFISDIVNLQGTNHDEAVGEFQGIVYDGLFGDWDAYPHTLIQYATAGTQTNRPDGEGALYAENATLYGHVVSSMDAHLAESGGEFASAVSIYFNGDHEFHGDYTNNLYPTLVAVAEDGTINWSPKTSQLAKGTYEFYIADIRGQYQRDKITNISQLPDHEKFFGKMSVTITDTHDEMEFYIDLEQVAKYLSTYSGTTIEASDFKMIEAKFGKIGNEILVAAGASTGPYMGIGICTAAVAAVLLKRRHKKAV